MNSKAVEFFYSNAGYSFDPKNETSEQGRQRCARELAEAELWAVSNGVRFSWERDLESAGEWVCCAWDSEGNLRESLCGVDLGDITHEDTAPARVDYARVIEAELALELKTTAQTGQN